jgi:carboxyl-terminal processing protease
MLGKNRILFLSVSSAIVVFVLAGIVMGNVVARDGNVYVFLRLFNDAVNLIENNYVEEVETDQLLRGAYHGLFEILDSNSEYLSPEEYSDFLADSPHPAGDVGMSLYRVRGHVLVLSVRPDGPADQAGISSGDQVLRIDGISTRAMSLFGADRRLRGDPGTEIAVTTINPRSDGSQDLVVTRASEPPPVEFEDRGDGTARLWIRDLRSDSATQVEEYLDRFREGGGQRLILDLRDNDARNLRPALDAALLFLENGPVAMVEERESTRTPLEEQVHDPAWSGPLVVLVNSGTASGAELLAASLQGSDRAPLLGLKTFGAGTRTEMFPLENGAAVQLSTGKLVAPDGTVWQGSGLTPDVPVEGDIDETALLEKAEQLLRNPDQSGTEEREAA